MKVFITATVMLLRGCYTKFLRCMVVLILVASCRIADNKLLKSYDSLTPFV